MEDMALELEEQRHHDAKMARLAKEKDIHDSLVAACETALTALQYHIGGNLSYASAREAISSIQNAIAKAKG